MKLNTDDDHVTMVTIETEVARQLLDLDLPPVLLTAIDEAQAPVFGQETRKAYLVIEIVP